MFRVSGRIFRIGDSFRRGKIGMTILLEISLSVCVFVFLYYYNGILVIFVSEKVFLFKNYCIGTLKLHTLTFSKYSYTFLKNSHLSSLYVYLQENGGCLNFIRYLKYLKLLLPSLIAFISFLKDEEFNFC